MTESAGIERPTGRDLTEQELLAVATQITEQLALSSAHVRHDPSQRVYERLLHDAHLDVWLICSMSARGLRVEAPSLSAFSGSGGRTSQIAPLRRQIPHLDEPVAAVGEMRQHPAPAIEGETSP
jgi:hypothetical protein